MADKTPKTLDGVPVTIDVGGKTTSFTVEATYTPETNDAGKVIKTSDGSFDFKNSDGNVLLTYNGADDTFGTTADTSDDLKRQVSNYITWKPGRKGIDYIVQVAAQEIEKDSKIGIGEDNNTSFIVNKNLAQDIIVENATQVISQAQLNIKAKNVRRDYGDYFYPEDIRSNKQDRIRFTMRQSEGSDISPRLGGFEGSRTKR